jgi:NADH-quinone oxidoreductase subunit E
MAQRRMAMRDGLFWGLTGAVFALIMAGAIGYVFAELYGAGWLSGGALAAAVFVVAGLILAGTATSANLPPPNTVKAPTAPPGGAFRAPPGGAFRAPDAPDPAAAPAMAAPQPAPARSAPAADPVAEIGQAAGEAVGKAAFAASAAVTSAAQAARAAIADVMGPPAVEARKPPTLDAPRDGAGDDLKKIKGVGPKLEEMLHGLGFHHFDQIAAWGPEELAWVDAHLEGFNGRATRDDWVGQARLLASGGETEFSRRVEDGEVY